MVNLFGNFLLGLFSLFLGTVNASTDRYEVTTIVNLDKLSRIDGRPSGIIADKTNNLYVSFTEYHKIKKVDKFTGVVTDFSGNGTQGYRDDDKYAARFDMVTGITIDSANNLYYVVDWIHDGTYGNLVTGGRIRKIDTTGSVTTLSSVLNAKLPYINLPLGITMDDSKSFYICDKDTVKIIYDSGKITNIDMGGTLQDIVRDSHGNLYVSENNGDPYTGLYGAIQKVEIDGHITTIAGSNSEGGSFDGIGTKARFGQLGGIAIDQGGNLYVCDYSNGVVRKIDTSGNVTTIAGSAGVIGSADGVGSTASFTNPNGITIDSNGDIYVTDPGNNTIRKLTLIKPPVTIPDEENTRGTASSINLGAAAGNATTASVEAGDDSGEEELGFRYSLNPQQIKLSMQSTKQNNYGASGQDRVFAKSLDALEKTMGATQAIRTNGKGLTFWVSGLYAQGQSQAIYGNPSMADHHYGIISGCHYTHKPTGQTIGLALDIGLGDSYANAEHDMKTTHRTAQMTIYYHKSFSKDWKFSANGSFMRSADRHQRPYTDNGNRNLAIAHGVTHVYSGSAQVKRKCKIVDGFNLKPFVGVNYSYTKQFEYEEKNAGDKGLRNNTASMDQIGVEFGIAATLFQPVSATKTVALLPQVTFTNFVKIGSMKQKIENVNTGHQTIAQSGTMGRNLLSMSLGVGAEDKEAQTRIKVAYTGHIQKYHKSHEVLLNFGVQF